jgi:diadenosine tetraphosphate (Ap4A) HIT family hydrolase
MNLEILWERFRIRERLVKEFDYWLVVVRPSQITLGACLFLLKRDARSLGELSADESNELVQVVNWFETKAAAVFGAEKFNYVVAMMKDPTTHFHAFPRYSTEQVRYAITWRDESWPKVIEFRGPETSEDILSAIRDDLKDG